MDGGDLVARFLQINEVPFSAMLCGGHTTPINTACKKRGIRVLDVRDEATAGFAAMGASILTGRPGVVVVTAGPGLTNLFTPVKTAIEAGVPMIVIAGAAATLLKGRGSLQDTDQIGYMRASGVKYAKVIERMSEIPQVLEEAYIASMQGVPGPVYIEIPMDLLYDPDLKQVQKEYVEPILRSCGKGAVGNMKRMYIRRKFKRMWSVPKDIEIPRVCSRVLSETPKEKEVEHVAHLLADAKKPVILLGSQIVFSQQRNGIQEIITRLGIPTFASGYARGALGKDHPLELKNVSAIIGGEKLGIRSEALSQADLVILVGVPPDFRLGYGKKINPKAKIVRLDLDPSRLKKNIKRAYPIRGDVGEGLRMLTTFDHVFEGAQKDWKKWYTELKIKQRQVLYHMQMSANEDAKPLDPLHVALSIRRVIEREGRDVIIVADGGDFVATAAKVISPEGIGRWLDAGPFGTLGTGAGFALAAKAIYPESDVVVLYGDGAFGWSLIELDTAVRHKLPFIGIIGNDACWTQIKRGDEEVFGKGESVATDLALVRYEIAVQGLGAHGIEIKYPHEIEKRLLAALDCARRGAPVVVNVLIGTSDFRKGSISV